MDRHETAKIVKMLLATLRLPRPIPDDEAHLSGWHLALCDLPYAVCERAAATILREERFMPEPATLRALALKELSAIPDPDEAWRLITYRVRGEKQWSLGTSDGARCALDEAVTALGGLSVLRRSETPEKDRDTFYRIWPQIVKRSQRNANLPDVLGQSPRARDALIGSEHAAEIFGLPVGADRAVPPGYALVSGTLHGNQLVKIVDDDQRDPGMGLVSPAQPAKFVPSSIVPREEN